jgi:hypothetical protein
MKTLVSTVFAAFAVSSTTGCSVEIGTEAGLTAEETAATCENVEGTNAAIASLATNIAQELGRWQITTDFYTYYGYQNQRMLGLTAAGLAACGGSCPFTSNMLAMQDARMDQQIILDNTRLSSWSFASRLTTGFDNQVSCQLNNQCPFVAHALGSNPTASPGPCGTFFTFPVSKPASQGGGTLTVSEATGLQNALIWTTGNGPNPYIAFQATSSTVAIDPTGCITPSCASGVTGTAICQKASLTDINDTPCTCATNNIYSNGKLRNDQPLTPRTYYCRQF